MNRPPQNSRRNEPDRDEKIDEDPAQLYNYPSIGKLFSDPASNDLRNLRGKLQQTRDKLDLINRPGSAEEAGRRTGPNRTAAGVR
jgi:hypothetical protein